MIKGGGYVGQTVEKNKWVRGVVCRSTQAQTLTVVACVILQCIPCFNECRCLMECSLSLCVRFLIYGSPDKVCQRFFCMVL
jgi:hypothetical protein